MAAVMVALWVAETAGLWVATWAAAMVEMLAEPLVNWLVAMTAALRAGESGSLMVVLSVLLLVVSMVG